MLDTVQLRCVWTVKEREVLPISHKRVWVPRLERHNIFTNYGLSALASAISGGYLAPIYLAIENTTTTIQVALTTSGATAVQVNARVDQPGDTQIALDIGTALQEVVTFTSVTTTAPFIYTLSTPTAYTHAASAYVVRQVVATDTITNIISEVQYDPVNAGGQRLSSSAGFSAGPGQWSIQFYYTATMATSYFATIGLCDSPLIGQGNLHNHLVLGYDHSGQTNDVQISGNLMLING